MSDSASKSDVEDVLSSVRRLVSSDVPRTRRPDLPKGPGALVLTDAQRVERPVSRGQAARSLEDRIAELEVAISGREDDYEPDGSEDQAQHTPDRIVYTRPPSDAEEANARKAALRLSQLSVVGPETSEDEADDVSAAAFRHTEQPPVEDASEDRPAPEAPMAEDVSALPEEGAEIRPFHNPDDMIDRFEARMDGKDTPLPEPGPGHNGFSERLAPYDPEESVAADDSADQVPEAEVAEDEPARAVEAADEESQGDREPSDDVIDEAFEADLTEAVTRSVAAEIAPDPAPAEETAPAEAGASEVPPTLGEDELRPLVAKLIREELQGDLGERITRNVRKLVRREILRAVNAREFE